MSILTLPQMNKDEAPDGITKSLLGAEDSDHFLQINSYKDLLHKAMKDIFYHILA